MKILKGWKLLLTGLVGILIGVTLVSTGPAVAQKIPKIPEINITFVPAVAQKAPKIDITIIPIREKVLAAPGHRIKREDLRYQNGILSFPVKDFHLGRISGSGSMLPMVDEGHLIIETKSFNIEEITVGDFVVIEKQFLKNIQEPYFKKFQGPYFHQVVKIDRDAKGWFAETRGINNWEKDLFIARKEDVKFLALGVLW